MISYENAIVKLAKNVSDLKKKNHYDSFQRRNQVVDIYGMEFTRQGDTNNHATFYISISQDLIYYERFEFKIIIQPFVIPIAANGVNPATLAVRVPEVTSNETKLSANRNNDDILISPETHSHTIPMRNAEVTPNPHSHTISAGITTASSTIEDFKVCIEGIDITSYLKAQYNGEWIHGEGIYPRADLSNYDILEAVGYMKECKRNKILKAGYKKIELKGTGVFNATLVNYLKYSHVNR